MALWCCVTRHRRLWLILKKRPVIFLHSYHHITVLLYCWHAYASRNSAGLWFATMNYCVHSLMCKPTSPAQPSHEQP